MLISSQKCHNTPTRGISHIGKKLSQNTDEEYYCAPAQALDNSKVLLTVLSELPYLFCIDYCDLEKKKTPKQTKSTKTKQPNTKHQTWSIRKHQLIKPFLFKKEASGSSIVQESLLLPIFNLAQIFRSMSFIILSNLAALCLPFSN